MVPIDNDTNAAYADYAADPVPHPTVPHPTESCPLSGYISAGTATAPGTIVKEFRSKLTGLSTNRNFVTVHFSELLQVTSQHDLGKGAILVEAVANLDMLTAEAVDDAVILEETACDDAPRLGLIDVWLPKKLCSNLVYNPERAPLNSNSVEVWNVFIRSNYPALELPEGD